MTDEMDIKKASEAYNTVLECLKHITSIKKLQKKLCDELNQVYEDLQEANDLGDERVYKLKAWSDRIESLYYDIGKNIETYVKALRGEE